ncbi:MAG: DNA-binding protein [Gammaproteobacteria bacterium]|nr:DNA-binding protein [Gammaproteobacteria bacterium]
MIRRTHFSIILLAGFSLSLLNAGIINHAYAAQENTKEVQQNDPGKMYGKVTDVIDVTGYTYAEVDIGKEKVWAAGPTTSLKIGDTVAFSSQMPMQNFHSKSLGRDFPIIYFINRYVTNKETLTTASAPVQPKQPQKIKPIKGINKVDGGFTIAEIHTDKSSLKDKIIRVRGKVTKFSAGIMGKNWLHIKDSSTLDDLTVTTNDTTAVGDIVIAKGKLELDKNYGAGYLYPVIMENATITKE